MVFDTHIHTEFSMDSEEKLDRIIETGKEKKVGVTITDHMDINDYMKEPFVFDVDKFFETYGPKKSEQVLLGIEMGLKVEAEERNNALAEKYDFDYVLGALHAPYYREDPYEYYDEPVYVGESKEGETKDEVYKGYFRNMVIAIERNDYFDSLAHIDYISRYAKYEDTEIYYDVYKEEINAVLRALIEKGKAMELSTRRLGDVVAQRELMKILRAFKDAGGEHITIGSDAHGVSAIGNHFELALKMVDEAGLTPVYFKSRKMIKIT